MKQINWFDRIFDFQINQNIMPSVIERLEGTSIRLREQIKLIMIELFGFSNIV